MIMTLKKNVHKLISKLILSNLIKFGLPYL